jgi:hypothetical protein
MGQHKTAEKGLGPLKLVRLEAKREFAAGSLKNAEFAVAVGKDPLL